MQVKLTEMRLLGEELALKLKEHPIMVFIGNLGAGKTTLIKYILSAMSKNQNAHSPTFAIVNTYIGAGGEEIFHFDCYRLKNIYEAMDIGLEEYLDSGSICLLEWPEVILDLIPETYWEVKIRHIDHHSRDVQINKVNV